MRWYLVILLVACLYMGQAFTAPAELAQRDTNVFALRDAKDDADATTTATGDGSSRTSSIITTTTNTTATTTSASSTTNSASQTTQSGKLATETSIPSLDSSSTSSDTQSLSNSTKMAYSGGLPIQPTITPAVGVGGFILLAAGGVLTFVGIRKPRIHIFLSTGLLAALGVTVLIEYVMSPPATNAVQGGYLVAIFSTAAVFGGLALVFKEITEGLCCLLGGFCIGMWLMTIKSGGLVTGDGAKVGFILAFAGGFYCLALSRYTRSYASMLCTAFGGSTTLVLGIDCYSRAGLKEFWLYVWGLNNDMFPLNTYTYPITRNIRVESAIIIIVTAFGVIFQMRLWKVIKARREKEETIRQEAQRQKDEVEAEVGRQLEENNLKERTEWEHLYGNKNYTKEPSMSETAVADDSRRGSESYGPSIYEKGGAVEMKEMASPNSARVSDCGNTLELVEEVVAEPTGHHQDDQDGQEHDENASHEADHAEPRTPENPASVSKQLKMETNIPADNDSEHGAVVGSEVGSLRSKRFSGRSFMNRLSWRSGHGVNPSMQTQSEEALIAIADSTSVVGIVDDLESIISGRPSLVSEKSERATETKLKETPGDNPVSEINETEIIDKNTSPENKSETKIITRIGTPDNDKEHVNVHEDSAIDVNHDTETAAETLPIGGNDGRSDEKGTEKVQVIELEGQTDPMPSDATQEQQKEKLEIVKDGRAKNENPVGDSKSTLDPGNEDNAENALAGSINDGTRPDQATVSQKPTEKAKLDVSTVQCIPEQTSRVVNSFRTREWAKHLADAEHPEFDPIQSEDKSEHPTAHEEFAAPVDMHGLLQTPLDAQPPPIIASSVPISLNQSYHRSYGPLASSELSQTNFRHSSQNMSSGISPPISRNVSSGSLNPPDQYDMAALRSSASTPYLNPNTAPKSQEAVDSPRWSGPPPLLAVRENMMRNRMSSTSLRYDPWTASRSQSRQSLADPNGVVSHTLSIPEERDEIEEVHNEDDVPLSKRRAMLQRQTMRSPSATSAKSLEQTVSPTNIPVFTTDPVDTGRSASVMAAWRQSVREDLSKSRDSLAFSSQGTSNQERPRNTWGSVQQMRDSSNTQLGNTIADEMQRGNMTDLHRKAMRRMQASANRQL